MATYQIILSGVSALIGKEMVSRAIMDSSQSIYNSIYLLFKNPELKIILEELDIEAQIKIAEMLVKEIPEINNSVHLALNHLHQSIVAIKDDLEKINYRIERHKLKWFNDYRSVNFKGYIKKLKKDYLILEKRLHILIKVLEVTRNMKND